MRKILPFVVRRQTLSFLFSFFVAAAMSQTPTTVRYVILVTIDGLRAEMIDDPQMPSPFLKMMSRDGLRIGRVIGIPPAATYPSHTTLVTGEVPARHRVFYNRPFLWNKDTARISYWYADSIAVPTIWQRAHEAGMKTASLFWPVSTGSPYIDYNVPEFWSLDYSCDQMEYIKPSCTPLGILDELERNACGKLDTITYQAGSLQRDGRTAAMANYLMNHYQPRLMTIHLITTDYSQHALGTRSQQLLQDMASADHAVGTIIENLRLTHRLDSTVVIVTGDHGFCDYSQTISPNVWLTRAGLLSERPGGEWKACFYGGGNTSFLYLRKANDTKTLNSRKKVPTPPRLWPWNPWWAWRSPMTAPVRWWRSAKVVLMASSAVRMPPRSSPMGLVLLPAVRTPSARRTSPHGFSGCWG